MAGFRSSSIESFLAEVSSANPTPGGGSLAALCAASAAGLSLMVCAIASKKKKRGARVYELAARLGPLKEALLDLVSLDAEAFAAVIGAYRLPEEDRTKAEAIGAALRRAAEVPLTVAEHGVRLLELLTELAPLSSRPCMSDVGVAAILGEAAIKAALLNVEINLAAMKDHGAIDQMASRKEDILARATDLAGQALSCVQARLNP